MLALTKYQSELVMDNHVVLERRVVLLTEMAGHLLVREQVFRAHCPLKVLLQDG